jgi:hypothetical protein
MIFMGSEPRDLYFNVFALIVRRSQKMKLEPCFFTIGKICFSF